MINCSNCGSENVIRKGTVISSGVEKTRVKCKECGKNSYIQTEYTETGEDQNEFIRKDQYIGFIQKHTKLVISCAVIGHEVNEIFLNSLENYCMHIGAQLVIIPIKYKNSDALVFEETKAEPYYIQNNFTFGNQYKIMGALKLNASMEHPLAGLDPLSKGKSVIFGHPQVALRTIANETNNPSIIATTGCVTEKNYTETKQGFKAEFNHSHSAVVLEIDIYDNTHIRHLNFDGEGFYDLEYYYSPQLIIKNQEGLNALITGDEHVIFNDSQVTDATYCQPDSIVKTLNPKIIVRHDVLDSYSISHHHKYNIFTKFAKHIYGYDTIREELDKTIEFIINTTPENTKNIIVSSNHNDHLLKWLNECDPKTEPWNAEIYHWFMFNMLRETKMGESGAEYPDPFELYHNKFYDFDMKFISRTEPYMIGDVSINQHGDIGTNGVRGSRRSFANLPTKHVIGHSHSPGIEKGVYQTGTSSKLRLEYNQGPSSWAHCHCIIYPNGKRQLIFIQNGVWRA